MTHDRHIHICVFYYKYIIRILYHKYKYSFKWDRRKLMIVAASAAKGKTGSRVMSKGKFCFIF